MSADQSGRHERLGSKLGFRLDPVESVVRPLVVSNPAVQAMLTLQRETTFLSDVATVKDIEICPYIDPFSSAVLRPTQARVPLKRTLHNDLLRLLLRPDLDPEGLDPLTRHSTGSLFFPSNTRLVPTFHFAITRTPSLNSRGFLGCNHLACLRLASGRRHVVVRAFAFRPRFLYGEKTARKVQARYFYCLADSSARTILQEAERYEAKLSFLVRSCSGDCVEQQPMHLERVERGLIRLKATRPPSATVMQNDRWNGCLQSIERYLATRSQ